MKLTRKEFIHLAFASAGAAALAACGDDTGGSGGGGTGGGSGGEGGGTTSSTTSSTTTSTTTTTTGNGGAGGEGGGTAGLVCTSDIGTNHGHELTVSDADVAAGVEKTYNIQGTSPHPHTVTVTAADFTTLAGGNSVTKTSSSDNAHTHMVTISCA